VWSKTHTTKTKKEGGNSFVALSDPHCASPTFVIVCHVSFDALFPSSIVLNSLTTCISCSWTTTHSLSHRLHLTPWYCLDFDRMAGNENRIRGMTKKSAGPADLLCGTTIRDTDILRILRHTNSGMHYRFIAQDSS
jgi:hypothetical protein